LQIDSHPILAIRWHPLAPTLLGFWAAAGQPRSPGRRRGREGARGRETARPKRFARAFRLRPSLVSHVPCPMPMLIPSHPIPSHPIPSHSILHPIPRPPAQHNTTQTLPSVSQSASQPGAQLASRQFLSLGSSGFAPPFSARVRRWVHSAIPWSVCDDSMKGFHLS
jgi:hypothetical protein